MDVTEEFPLDIKCTLLITKDDMQIYEDIKERMRETEEERRGQGRATVE